MIATIKYGSTLNTDNYFGGGNFRNRLGLNNSPVNTVRILYNHITYDGLTLGSDHLGRLHIPQAEKERFLANNPNFGLGDEIIVDISW